MKNSILFRLRKTPRGREGIKIYHSISIENFIPLTLKKYSQDKKTPSDFVIISKFRNKNWIFLIAKLLYKPCDCSVCE